MLVRFVHQALLDRTVHAAGSLADLPEPTALRLVAAGVAESAVREAVAAKPEGVRRAVRKRGDS